ncbi:MAG: aspartate carbamoyltransferase [Clostridia bacterium]|nr:aspartate carbamoyltransferase [Clostridia bacterium]
MKRSVIDILDLSVAEIDSLIQTATDIMDHPAKYAHACDGKILATLFFEPSTRTRLSFESAMYSLGGHVISVPGSSNSSVVKGESVADTAHTVSCYADIIAMRHPQEGAALVLANAASIPIINAGDGGHCHPTQTLADLLTIHREMGHFDHLTIGVCGDLKYGRTVHSLIEAMSRYPGVRFVMISPETLRAPTFVRDALNRKQIPYRETTSLEEAMPELDILYMTRVQRERFSDPELYERVKDSYILTPEKLRTAKSDMRVMHPLPRVNEISVQVDEDPRACYFKQMLYGRYMRMALILMLLGDTEFPAPRPLIYDRFVCKNHRCISQTEQELRHAFYQVGDSDIYRCVYCEAKAK